MKVPQVSVFLEKRPGSLCQACKLLAEAGLNLVALTVADGADSAVMRFLVGDADKAVDVLRANGLSAETHEVLAIEVPDQPGGLSQILEVLDEGGVDIEYIYAFSHSAKRQAILIFRFEDPDKAIELLQSAGINVLRKVDVLE